MNLLSLEMENFRNIKQANFLPNHQLTIITGENGQGKTNLLEAIFLLTGSKSFRSSKDLELVKRGELFSRLYAKVQNAEENTQIEIYIQGEDSPKRGRFAKVNGVDYGRATSIAGTFTAVVFAPVHLGLIKGGPEGRRRFVDAALCQLYPEYIVILKRFIKTLAQKNALLKKYREISEAFLLLDVYDQELAETGEEISRRRREYLANIGPMAEHFYSELSQNREGMQLRFLPCCEVGGLLSLLKKKRENDLRFGFSSSGPQREDFEAKIDGQSARIYGSQGQQRSAVLSLKLAEAKRAYEVKGEHPVMLLDDVLSELDEKRQSFLLSGMEGKQNFLTTCDPELLKKTGGKVVFMQKGMVYDTKPAG